MRTSRRVPRRSLPLVLTALGALAIQAGPVAQDRPLLSGLDLSTFDRSVRPQDDFNGFVNGTWMKTTEIPADRSVWGAFSELGDDSDAALRDIVAGLSTAKTRNGAAQQVADFYASFMDTSRIEALGIEPLGTELKAIAALTVPADLPGLLGRFQRVGISGPFFASVGQDPKQSTSYVVSINQTGLGMPDRDYYLRKDAKADATREAYLRYIETLLTLARQNDAAGAARRILTLETQIAEKQWDRARSRDRDATYNKKTVAELSALTPSFAWPAFLKAATLDKATSVIVRQPDYLAALDPLIRNTPITTWKELLTFKLLAAYSDELPEAFGKASFEFRGRTLAGQQEMRARDKRGIDEVEGALGEALGRLYVEKHFAPEAKARMDQLVKNVLAAFAVGIDELEWMSPATKAEAHAKLKKFTVKIGYPDEWRDYSTLDVKPGDLLGNAKRSVAFQYDDMTGRLGKPVDRKRWNMTPQTVNAYYSPPNNEIVFPAAILQPPFFNAAADDAVNYGGIGAVIGHEISHGFDDQGSKSDGDGNLRNWFTADDLAAFKARTSKLAAQYAAYTPLEGLPINGALTLGENIGDLSGLAVAYRAYHLSLGGRPAPVIDGFTGDQRFFLGWAQVWRTKMRDDALRQRLVTDPHSPGTYRAFVPLTNMQAFYDAFDVKPGDKMYRPPADRVTIW